MADVLLTGTFTRLDGTPATGTVRITPSRSPIMDPDGKVVISGPQTFPLDKDGKIAVTIPATDDPSLGDAFTYTATANMAHTTDTIRNIVLPHTEFEIDLTGATAEELKPPTGFPGLTSLPAPSIIRRGGKYTATLDLEALRPPEGATYYTAPTALNTNDGLTPETPLTITQILQDKPDVGTIVLADGIYARGWSGTALGGSGSLTRDVNWVAAPGANPILTSTERVQDLTWTHIGGHVYATSRSAASQVFDIENLNVAGDWTAYAARDTHAEIDGPGQWAIEGSTVHVWAIGDTDLTMSSDQIRVSVLSRVGIVAANSTQYVEGIEFVGMHHNSGSYVGGIIANVGSTIIAKSCAVRHNLTDGFKTLNGGHLIAVDCEASSNSADGFNYHDTQYNGGEFIEIDCHAHHNGQVEGASTNNGSTAHEGVKGIRVGGVYEQSHGPVVADVNKAKTWNVDCAAGDSTTHIVSQSSAWRVDGTGSEDDSAVMWLEKCRAHGANTGLKATGGAQIRHRQTVIDGVAVDTEGDVAPFI